MEHNAEFKFLIRVTSELSLNCLPHLPNHWSCILLRALTPSSSAKKSLVCPELTNAAVGLGLPSLHDFPDSSLVAPPGGIPKGVGRHCRLVSTAFLE